MDGWATRGESDGPFNPLGLILHHDAMGLGFRGIPSQIFNVPANMSQNGIDGSQLWVARSGEWWTMAAGRKWHAGLGQWQNIPTDDGNSCTIGVETDHTVGDPWESQQFDSINIGCRALAAHYALDIPGMCCGHREYAPTRKIDPDNFDLDAWRTFLSGTTAPIGDLDMTPAQEAKLDRVLVLLGDGTDRPVNENLSIIVRNTYASDVIDGSAPTLAGAIGRRLNDILAKIK